jgi:ABC-type transport system substrate-binding protein
MRYSNPTVDAALKQLPTTTDKKTIQSLYNTVVGQILKDVPVVFFARFHTWYAQNKAEVQGWHMYYNVRPFFEDVWLAKQS